MSSFIPLRILIVEDEPLVARDIHQTLTKAGCEVTGLCTTGAQAIDAVRLQQPDLVLMDIQLPGDMDGIEAASRVQREFHRPVVFLTGHADATTNARARTAE